ncbi:uncharacterized protein LOC128390140 [Panonychus citri]|uniref:uncharacterized protein LOC128390140 n=1 Tax=Panonychus citri TaxID=50023 RepID=UPI00230766BA|nr:uncharacterized protein LOC128390140 [Panonychus citri]
MNVIIKCEDQYDHQVGEPGEIDKTNCRWKSIQYNPQAQPLKQIEQSTKHLELVNCLNTSSPSSPQTITSLSSSSTTTTTTNQTPFIGLSKFGDVTTTIEKNHLNHSRRLVNDNPYPGLAQSYASIVENYSTNCNNRRTNSNCFNSPDYRLTLPTAINPSSLDSASFIRRRNERERARVKNVNEGFDRLRKHLPLTQSQREKRLSKVETLRMAISYIKHLEILLTPK